ncbi:hypothetical protein ACTVPQ_24520 [Serratia bockelmannii]|uniref:hypothetical protein n=1 Tax=Serratia bockelmannii TaxID=2703793 RepID=UPI003FA7692B
MINLIISGQTKIGKTTAMNVIHPDNSKLVEVEKGVELLNMIGAGHGGGIYSVNNKPDYQKIMVNLALKYNGGE